MLGTPKKKGREPSAPAPDHAGDPPRVAGNSDYLQILRPLGPLHLLEQQSELDVQEAPAGEHRQAGKLEQFGSAQSMRPSQSLSMPSLQTSVTGAQVPGSRKGFTAAK